MIANARYNNLPDTLPSYSQPMLHCRLASSNSAVKIVVPKQVLQQNYKCIWHLFSAAVQTCPLSYVQPWKFHISILREGFVVAVNAHAVASFPGLPTVQFLIACSKQKRKGKAWSILSHEQHFVYLGRHRGEGCLIEETSLRPHLVVSVPSAGFRMITKRKAYHSCFKRRTCVRNVFFWLGTTPPPVYLGRQYGI